MTIFWYVFIFILHFVLTLMIQRLFLKIAENPESESKIIMFVMLFIPYVGLFSSIAVLLIEVVTKIFKKYKLKNFNIIERIYRIK
jgi:hypothetical protein